MFSALLPPPVVAGVLAGVELVRGGGELRARLRGNVESLCAGLRDAGYEARSESAIVPLLLKEGVDIRALGRRIHEEGWFCNLIEAPVVPADSQRIRLSMMATHEERDLRQAVEILARCVR
jgi:7-keto-8-aminopelargonate synthetase-like enzyme